MGSSEMTAAGVDSDGSVSWEDFFGTSTDLVPQLLGMFDELARKDQLNNNINDQIPSSIQKRLSLVAVHSQRNTIFGQICAGKTEQPQSSAMQYEINRVVPSLEHCIPSPPPPPPLPPPPSPIISSIRPFSSSTFSLTLTPPQTQVEITVSNEKSNDNELNKKNTLTPKYGGRRKRNKNNNNNNNNIVRPLSGSSIASSTSSSECSNQGNTGSVNPYLTSVESLADTCASSQGSGDSGVVTTSSEVNCQIIINDNSISPSIRTITMDPSPPFMFHRARYCDPQRNSVEKVLLEIVDTEAIYVEHLRQVIQGYLIYWRNDPLSLLQETELNNLFSNIEDIYQFNNEFLDEIEKCGLNPVKAANTFTKRNSGFKVYTEYCTNYPRTVETLTNLMGHEDTAKAFRERQAALCHALPLGSFLLKPVQRILKYHLLLESLSREYDSSKIYESIDNNVEGQKAIDDALDCMMGIAKHINAMKRKHEHAVRVQEIQSLLYGWSGPDLTTSGELVAEGRFRMRGAKAPRHAFLFDKMLLLTKKKEDGLLVYKAHIMCSNLMLIESIPGEASSFHVIPFDNPRLQYTLQARNSEQKREWTLQIKRVMLENYNAVIPIHAQQLVLQLGQTHQDDDTNCDKISMKKQYSSPPEYLERRKQDKERRRSEAGQKSKKLLKSETTDNSPLPLRKIDSTDEQRDKSLNRSLDCRASKVKDRFTNWRRKSEPGFQSYVSLNQSDEEQIENTQVETEVEVAIDALDYKIIDNNNSERDNEENTKEINEQQKQNPPRTVEEIVGHILMQNQEFQKLLEKQRNNSMTNVRQQQRFHKHQNSVDTSDDSDAGEANYQTDISSTNNSSLSINTPNNNSKENRAFRRENRLTKSNNNWNSLSSSRDNTLNLRLQYNNLKIENNKSQTIDNITKINTNRVYEKKAMFEHFKKQSIVTQSKIIKTALRIRENSSCEDNQTQDKPKIEEKNELNMTNSDLSLANSNSSCGNYDNLQNLWNGLENRKDPDSPTRPAIWLTKLCEGLPTSPQKCGSLPRSFQMNPTPQTTIAKSRFLQRDGKPMTERPFTIASDKPAEINLEDMERYASNYQPEGRIAKFPISSSSVSATSSTFSCSIEDNLTDANHMRVTETDIHPDHKIYRANGNKIFKNVLSKAGNRLQGLRSTVSAETLESVDYYDEKGSKKQSNKGKKKNKLRLSRESSTDIDEPSVGCMPVSTTNLQHSSLYYKQGSSGLGARIAQADYADPSVLFFDSKRTELIIPPTDSSSKIIKNSTIDSTTTTTTTTTDEIKIDDAKKKERNTSEIDSFYERCFETIENYADCETDDAFRDSAIFSDGDESNLSTIQTVKLTNDNITKVRAKIAPPVPIKLRKSKPSIARKPDNLKMKVKVIKKCELVPQRVKVKVSSTSENIINNVYNKKIVDDKNDVSAGQSQAGWVKKMVGQLQGQIET